MKLEQLMYESKDLKDLSATKLYNSGPLFRFGPLAPSGPLRLHDSPPLLYIKDFDDGSSLHIHFKGNEEIQYAKIKGYRDNIGSPISNYEAMLLDILHGRVHMKDE